MTKFLKLAIVPALISTAMYSILIRLEVWSHLDGYTEAVGNKTLDIYKYVHATYVNQATAANLISGLNLYVICAFALVGLNTVRSWAFKHLVNAARSFSDFIVDEAVVLSTKPPRSNEHTFAMSVAMAKIGAVKSRHAPTPSPRKVGDQVNMVFRRMEWNAKPITEKMLMLVWVPLDLIGVAPFFNFLKRSCCRLFHNNAKTKKPSAAETTATTDDASTTKPAIGKANSEDILNRVFGDTIPSSIMGPTITIEFPNQTQKLQYRTAPSVRTEKVLLELYTLMDKKQVTIDGLLRNHPELLTKLNWSLYYDGENQFKSLSSEFAAACDKFRRAARITPSPPPVTIIVEPPVQQAKAPSQSTETASNNTTTTTQLPTQTTDNRKEPVYFHTLQSDETRRIASFMTRNLDGKPLTAEFLITERPELLAVFNRSAFVDSENCFKRASCSYRKAAVFAEKFFKTHEFTIDENNNNIDESNPFEAQYLQSLLSPPKNSCSVHVTTTLPKPVNNAENKTPNEPSNDSLGSTVAANAEKESYPTVVDEPPKADKCSVQPMVTEL